MKRILWLLTLVPFLGISQEVKQDTDNSSNQKYVEEKGNTSAQTKQTISEVRSDNQLGNNTPAQSSKDSQSLHYSLAGVTHYDLQTNFSVGRNLLLHGDGTMSAVWSHCFCPSDNQFGERGTGYNYHDGNKWVKTPTDIERIEDRRVGWPTINVDKSGNTDEIFTIGHLAPLAAGSSSGGYSYNINSGKGGTQFSTSYFEQGTGPIWYRTAQASGSFHMIGNYFTSSDDSFPRKGINYPMTYYRSNDYGQTWEDSQILLPGYADTMRRLEGTADNYSISARDSVVAIAIATRFPIPDVTLYKSTDTGKTWTKHFVDSFRINLSDQIGDISFPFWANDGTISSVIDNEGTVHVSYGVKRYDRLNAQGQFVPSDYANGIHYWNENTDSVVEAAYMDGNNLTTGDITTDSVDASQLVVPTSTEDRLAPYSGASLATQPTLISGGQDTIFLIYSASIYGSIIAQEANFRDIYVNFSTDGGLTWDEPTNVTKTATGIGNYLESVYPSAYPYVEDGELHFLWQQDRFPGAFYGEGSYQKPNGISENKIYYGALSVDSVLKDNVGDNIDQGGGPGSVANNKNSFSFETFPNPFENGLKVSYEVAKPADVQVKLYDMVGKVQVQKDLGHVERGSAQLNVNTTDLNKGVYFLELQVGNETRSKKVVKQ